MAVTHEFLATLAGPTETADVVSADFRFKGIEALIAGQLY